MPLLKLTERYSLPLGEYLDRYPSFFDETSDLFFSRNEYELVTDDFFLSK